MKSLLLRYIYAKNGTPPLSLCFAIYAPRKSHSTNVSSIIYRSHESGAAISRLTNVLMISVSFYFLPI